MVTLNAVSEIFHPFLIAAWIYALYLGINAIKKTYGGKFTSIFPQFLAAVALLLLIQIVEFSFKFNPLHETVEFFFSIQMLQLLAGIFFMNSIYQIYKMGFATSSFFGGK